MFTFTPGKNFAGIDGEISFRYEPKGEPGTRNSSISRRGARRTRKNKLQARAKAKARG